MRVDALVLTPEVLAETVTATGTLLAAEGVELRAEVNGRITAIRFDEGAAVKAGDLLVKLNDADLRARYLAATRELEFARLRERRAAELVTQKYVRQDEHDEALNVVRVLEAEIALIEAEIAKTEIRAPFDGTAGLRYVSEGAFVDASSRIATVQRTDTLKIEFSVPERHAGRIRIGSLIGFRVAGIEDQFEGRVYAFDPRIDQATRTLAIRAICPNENGRLFPGAFASVELTLTRTEDALMVPAVALVPDLGAPYVFVLVNGTAEQRRVVTGTRTDSRVQILSGLRPGDIVITTGVQQLRTGAAVDAVVSGEAPLSTEAGGAPDASPHVAGLGAGPAAP